MRVGAHPKSCIMQLSDDIESNETLSLCRRVSLHWDYNEGVKDCCCFQGGRVRSGPVGVLGSWEQIYGG